MRIREVVCGEWQVSLKYQVQHLSGGNVSRELLVAGRDLFENQFNSVIGNRFAVVSHKMVPGQLVGIHNNLPEQDRRRIENFRLVCYVDRDFQDEKGGHLILFGSKNVSDVLDAVRPVFNSAILMQLSDNSFHAVSRVRWGTRYSIVASYWGYSILSLYLQSRIELGIFSGAS